MDTEKKNYTSDGIDKKSSFKSIFKRWLMVKLLYNVLARLIHVTKGQNHFVYILLALDLISVTFFCALQHDIMWQTIYEAFFFSVTYFSTYIQHFFLSPKITTNKQITRYNIYLISHTQKKRQKINDLFRH